MQMGNKPRKWWLAGLLSLFEPGLGQIYNGQARKGICILFLPLLFLPIVTFSVHSDKFVYFVVIFLFLAAIFYMATVGDAIRTALKLKTEYHLKKYNKIIVYVGVVLMIVIVNTAISGIIKNNFVQAYKLPSASNEPTLVRGDHILTDRSAHARNPERGSFIVFEFPEDPKKDFIKRVVAIGGDIVEVQDKVLLINNAPVNENYIVHKDTNIFSDDINPRDNFGPVTIPEGACFVLGDNRDFSYDSRFWGVVENSKIKGTVKKIYWSWDSGKKSVRWGRIGKRVN
jgi:signal peptidase I